MDLFSHVFMFQGLQRLEWQTEGKDTDKFFHYTWPLCVHDITECIQACLGLYFQAHYFACQIK